jgi:hypothetical protein
MQSIHPAHEQYKSHAWTSPSDLLTQPGQDALSAHPIFVPVAWLACLILGLLFWLAMGYYVVSFF